MSKPPLTMSMFANRDDYEEALLMTTTPQAPMTTQPTTGALGEVLLAQMRAYNPLADEYRGKHTIPYWARCLAEINAAHAARVGELEAEVARLRKMVASGFGSAHSHACRACGHRYTPARGTTEDCPACGNDGTDEKPRRDALVTHEPGRDAIAGGAAEVES